MPYYWKIPFADPDGNSFEARVLNPDGAADVLLHGSIHPLTVEEDIDDFMHRPIRKQSGYLGIVDQGTDIGGQEQFDWTDLFPSTVTDRLVELWNTDDDEMLWWGFLKPETFSGKLNLLPQERKFPVVGPLDVLEAFDFAPATTGLINLGGVLDYIISQVPELCDEVHITDITFQGIDAVDDSAEGWLYQRLSPALFYDTDDDGTLTPKYNCLEVLEKVCQFLGLTARTHGTSLWFVAPTDAIAASLTPWSVIRVQDLATIAQGNAPTHIDIQWADTYLTGSPFASTSNEETFIPGVKKVTVEEDVDSIDSVVELPTNEIAEWGIKDEGGATIHGTVYASGRQGKCGWYLRSVWSGLTFDFSFKDVDLKLTNGGMLLLSDYDDNAYSADTGGTLLKRTYNWTPKLRIPYTTDYPLVCTITGKRPISLADGVLVLHVETLIDVVPSSGHKQWNGYGTLHMSIRVGNKFWNQSTRLWQSTEYICAVVVGGSETANGQGTIANSRDLSGYWPNAEAVGRYGPYPPYNGWSIPVENAMSGVIELKFYGSLIANPQTVFGTSTLTDTYIDVTGLSFEFLRGTTYSNWSSRTKNTYTATNNGCTGEIKVDNIMTTDRNNAPGNGLLFGTSGEYCQWLPYDGQQDTPGDRVARTIAAYYSRPRRKLSLELRRHLVSLTPGTRVIYNGTDYYPISISHDWYDDVTSAILLEL